MSVIERVRPAAHDLPTEESPERGRVMLAGAPFSEALRWEQDGVHFIRSTEFDASGHGSSLREAIREFIGQSIDVMKDLSVLVKSGDATEYECEVAALLGSRFAQVAEATQKKLPSRVKYSVLGLVRHTGQHTRSWRATQPARSKPLSHA